MVTLVEGRTFCLSTASGDIVTGRPDGLFLLDSRLISRWELLVDGELPEPLSVSVETPSVATFALRGRAPDGQADSTLLIMRRRYVGGGMREDVTLRNHSLERVDTRISLAVACDFADLFEVKDGRAARARHPSSLGCHVDEPGQAIRFVRYRQGEGKRTTATVTVAFSNPPTSYPQGEDRFVTWDASIPPGAEWSTCIQVSLAVNGEPLVPSYRCGEEVSLAQPTTELKRWRQEAPLLATDFHPLEEACSRAVDDIGSLRIFDPDHPDEAVIAAGAPWFMTLFGRDSLISSWMALTIDPDLALGVLDALARLQGTKLDPATEEQPGRILHEVRFDRTLSSSFADSSVYYGSVDATPLFVMLLGELRRWGLVREDVDRLLPHADRALGWIENFGDRDGDGYVEYQRSRPDGLVNQGWKDSWDSISFADGRLAEPPIALAEVQGYVYAAYRARAYFAREAGDMATDARYTRLADDLKKAFNRDFWIEDRGYFAIGLDRDKKQIDSLASNMGHCLLTGLVDADRAKAVVDHLLSPEMFTGWGIRTLAATMARYNPISYHNGSVWPHDNAMIAAGMMRYGFVEEAHRVILAILEVASAFGGRLPELFGGLDRSAMSSPLAYPASCSPQAWAAASPILMLRTLLRLDPWVPFNKVWLAPALPEGISRMRVDGIPLGPQRISVICQDGEVSIKGASPGIEIVREPRPPLGEGRMGSE
jgi:glycogen debranching enzyme